MKTAHHRLGTIGVLFPVFLILALTASLSYAISGPAIEEGVGLSATLNLLAADGKLNTKSPAVISGKCPQKIDFKGHINSPAAGVVKYRFIRSDGGKSGVQTLKFEKTASKEVLTSWKLGQQYKGWIAIQIESPQKTESNKAHFELVCGEEKAAEPTGMPPAKAANTAKSEIPKSSPIDVKMVVTAPDGTSSSDRLVYSGDCFDKRFHVATVFTARQAGTYSYAEITRDDSKGAPKTITFDKPGKKSVDMGIPADGTKDYWMQVNVLKPVQ